MWVLLATVTVWACTYDSPEDYAVDPASTDAVAPSAPDVSLDELYRGYEERVDPATCETVPLGCTGLATVALSLSATDDEAPAAELGYRIEIEGDAPALAIGSGVVRAEGGSLYLRWSEGETDALEPLAFTLRVFAVDLAGNEGPPTEIAVDHPGGPQPLPEGCEGSEAAEGSKPAGSCTTTGGAAGAWCVAALLALSRRRRSP